MNASFSIGDRVNVSKAVTESWRTKHELRNARVSRIDDHITYLSFYITCVKGETTSTKGCPFYDGGHFADFAYNIERV